MGLESVSVMHDYRLVAPTFFGLAWAVYVSHLEYPCYTYTEIVS